MKTKLKNSNRILSLVLVFVMVLGMMPMTAYAAADTSAYAPVRYENLANSDRYDYSIFANGTAITIEAAPNGTRVWYMDGTTKKYVTNNGENGEDLSGWYIFAGSINPDGMRGVDGYITMTGGTVGYIFAGQYYGYFSGTSNITITGGTVKNNIFCNAFTGSSATNDDIGTVTIFDATGATINTGYDGKADNVVQKNGTTWRVSGNGIIPTGVTLTVNAGETLTVPSGATLRNNGSLVNNGGTITVYGQLLGNAPVNYVAPSDFAFTTTTLNANVSTTLTTPTASPDNTTLVPWFTYEIADAGTADAVINGATITPYGAGIVKVKVIMHDGYCTPIEKVYDFPVSFTAVTDISGTVPTECWVNRNNALPTSVTPSDASYRTVTWSVVDAGTTGAAISGNQLKATNSGTATIRATVANGNAYGVDFVKDYTVTFKATDTIDIGQGSVTILKIDDSTVRVQYALLEGGSKDYSIDEPIVITGTSTSNQINVSGGTPYIVLNNVNLQGEYPFNLYENENSVVTLELVGTNTIKSTYLASAAISVNGNKIIIDGEGSLYATGGGLAACIGARRWANAGTIIINGGTIVAENDYGIGGSLDGGEGTVIINGGNIKTTKITGTLKDENDNSLSLNTITLSGAADGTVVTDIEGVEYGLNGVKTLGNKLYFYLPSGAAATSITAGGVVYDCKAGLTYYPGHDYVDATCVTPHTCQQCGHTVGEALGHSYVDGVCTTCGIGETDDIFYISTAEQLMKFADYVNAGNQSADAILMADIDLTDYAWTTICETDLYYNAYGTDLGYSGTLDGNGHVIKNITVTSSTTRDASCGLFGTVSGTIKNLGIENFTFVDGGKDIRTGAIVGQLITANGKVSNCYVKNATINPGAHVTGGIAGCVYDGTIENCYVVESNITGSSGRYGHIVGDSRGDGGASDRPGTVTNCYTDNATIRSNNVGNVTNCATKTTDDFANGEVTYLLNGSTSEGDLVWGQLIGTDSYPVFGGETVYFNETDGYYNILHICDFSGEWKYDADKHWKECECGLLSEEGRHDGGTATYTPNAENSTKHDVTYDCCGAVVIEDCYISNELDYIVFSDGATCIGTCVCCKRTLATITIVAPACKTYGDGNSCEATILLDGEPVEVSSDRLTYKQWMNDAWEKLDTVPTNAGTYRAEGLVFDETYYGDRDVIIYVEYTIAKARYHYASPIPKTLTYNAEEQNLIYAGTVEGADFEYSLDGESWSTTIPQAKEVGDYTVYYRVVADENHYDIEGSVDVTIKECTHSYGEGVLVRPEHSSNPDIGSIEGYYYYTCTLCGNKKFEPVEGADYSAYDAIVDKVNEYLRDATLTNEAKQEIYSTFTNFGQDNENISIGGFLRNDLMESEQAIVDEVVAEMQEIIDSVEEKIASGEYVKADYTEIDEAIAEIEQKLADENITDEGKAGLEEIKEQLTEMKADGNTSEADLAEFEKALEDYEAELDAGIEDGTLVKVDGMAILGEYNNELRDELYEKYGEEKYLEVINSSSEEVKAEVMAITNEVIALTGTVAENAEKIAELKERLKALFDATELCLAGTHSYKYEVSTPAKCEVNAKETGICWVCGATDEREVENSALSHSFTKYEETEAPKCGVAGKEVATCDNGCGETDEKEIAALTHKDADGDGFCDNDCGTQISGGGDGGTGEPEPDEPDTPDEPADDTCDHLCHKSGFLGFIWKIVRFFQKLFGIQQYCDCGVTHW